MISICEVIKLPSKWDFHRTESIIPIPVLQLIMGQLLSPSLHQWEKIRRRRGSECGDPPGYTYKQFPITIPKRNQFTSELGCSKKENSLTQLNLTQCLNKQVKSKIILMSANTAQRTPLYLINIYFDFVH